MYVLVRRDLPLADQIVQAAHAAQESGARFGCPEACHMVMCGVDNESELMKAASRCVDQGVELALFYEPDPIEEGGPAMGHTALCTQPVYGHQRRIFRRYQTWKS